MEKRIRCRGLYRLITLIVFGVVSLAAYGDSAVLRSPIRITLLDSGNIAVSEYAQQKVVILDRKTLARKSELEINGNPLGLAWVNEQLYVGNDTTSLVEIYTQQRSGKWRLTGSLGGPNQLIPEPSDLAVDETNERLFVLSGELGAVLAYSLNGQLLGTLGTEGDAQECLHTPTAIAVNPFMREVLVSDYGNPALGERPAIKIFDYEGNFLAGLCGDSTQEGFLFSRPQGVTVNEADQIFLADALLGQVLVFDRVTLLGIGTLGAYGTDSGELRLPLDVTIDEATMDALVTNNRLGRVEIFSEGGLIP